MPNPESGQPEPSAPPTDLAQLVTVERELEQRLIQARGEAAALLEAARREAEDLTTACEQECETARVRVQAGLEQERVEQEAKILAVGRTRAAWYDELPASTLADLAGAVLDSLHSGGHE
jgi:ferredoxin